MLELIKMLLKTKFEILETLFKTVIFDKNGRQIDYDEGSKYIKHLSKYLYNGERALATAYCYLKKQLMYKSDLQYCNKIIKNLIKIVGLDEKKITRDYLKTVLHFQIESVIEHGWIDAYKQLIIYIKIKNGTYY